MHEVKGQTEYKGTAFKTHSFWGGTQKRRRKESFGNRTVKRNTKEKGRNSGPCETEESHKP